jgi:hypothetical protein
VAAVLGLEALGEGAAEAAVEDDDLPARARRRHDVVDVAAGDRGGAHELAAGVLAGAGHSEVQLAALVLDAMAGEVKEEEVVGLLVGEQVLAGLGELAGVGVDEDADLVEARDLLEHVRHGLGVAQRRG